MKSYSFSFFLGGGGGVIVIVATVDWFMNESLFL